MGFPSRPSSGPEEEGARSNVDIHRRRRVSVGSAPHGGGANEHSTEMKMKLFGLLVEPLARKGMRVFHRVDAVRGGVGERTARRSEEEW